MDLSKTEIAVLATRIKGEVAAALRAALLTHIDRVADEGETNTIFLAGEHKLEIEVAVPLAGISARSFFPRIVIAINAKVLSDEYTELLNWQVDHSFGEEGTLVMCMPTLDADDIATAMTAAAVEITRSFAAA